MLGPSASTVSALQFGARADRFALKLNRHGVKWVFITYGKSFQDIYAAGHPLSRGDRSRMSMLVMARPYLAAN